MAAQVVTHRFPAKDLHCMVEAGILREVKVPPYAHYGIPETWLVDVERGLIEVYRDPSPDGYCQVQATVVGKMLEQVGFTVEHQMLDSAVYNQKTEFRTLDQPAEHQAWDIALTSGRDPVNFPVIQPYRFFALDGPNDWVLEEPELQRLHAEILRTVDREQQQVLLRQIERHTRDQAYFLFLYNPVKLYAVNNAVDFVPYVCTQLNLAETSVTDQHWSVRRATVKTE